jgi:RHS repeat-associated protein
VSTYNDDANGNRTSANGSTYTTGANNEILFDGTYTYTYDAEENRTAKFIDANHDGVLDAGDTNVTTYAWDARERLTEVRDYATFASFSSNSPTQVVDYLYDVENRWIGENIDSNGDGQIDHEIRFAYDGNQIVLQFDKDLSPLPPGEGQGEGISVADLSHRYTWQPNAVDQLMADENVTTGNVVWPLANQQGTINDLAVCNSQTGITSVANHRVFDTFGNLKSQTNAAVDCLFGFTGRPTDTASGLQNNLNRWTDPRTADWMSQDPDGFTAGDTNTYRCCGNSPTNGVDPSGLFTPANHKAITQAALAKSGLSGGAISVIVFWDVEQDDVLGIDLNTPLFVDANHMDNSQFGPAIKAMQERTDTARKLLSANLVLKQFGMIAHAIQDFYAHSNYVELMDARAGGKSTIGSIPIATALLNFSPASLPSGIYSGAFNIVNPRTWSSTLGTAPRSHQALNKDDANSPEGKILNKVGVSYFALAKDLAIRTTAAAWPLFFNSLSAGMQLLIKSIG